MSDLAAGWRRRDLWHAMAWQDVRQRYRRSVLGPFWITASMGVMVFALGLLYGSIFKQDVRDYLPFLAAGFIVWGLISTLILDGSRAFIDADAYIRQLPAPLSLYVYRLVWASVITFGHNLIIFVVVAIIFRVPPSPAAMLALIGLGLVLVNGFWMALLIGLLSARFRDIPLVVASVVQIMFFLTPVIWMPTMLPQRALILDLNPFHHLIEIVRGPMLGDIPAMHHWLAVLLLTFAGWSITIWIFGKYRWRIAYWV